MTLYDDKNNIVSEFEWKTKKNIDVYKSKKKTNWNVIACREAHQNKQFKLRNVRTVKNLDLLTQKMSYTDKM